MRDRHEPVPQDPRNRLLTQAAREILRPLGLRQKGRSRTWLDDHGWWIGVVEFQPSAWANGSYLNVGVTWLWHLYHPPEEVYLYFSLSDRIHGFIEYGPRSQFWPEAQRLAALAASQVVALRERLPDLGAAATVLTNEARQIDGWATWEAAVALGLVGDVEGAQRHLAAVVACEDEAEWWQPVKRQAAAWAQLLRGDERAFRKEVRALIRRNRAELSLDPDHPRLAEI